MEVRFWAGDRGMGGCWNEARKRCGGTLIWRLGRANSFGYGLWLAGRMHIIWSLVYWSFGCSATRALRVFGATNYTALPCISSMEHLLHRFAAMSSGDSSTELLDIIIKRLRYAPLACLYPSNAINSPIPPQIILRRHTPYRFRHWVPLAPVPHGTELRRQYSSISRSHYPRPVHPTSDTKPY